MRSLIRFQGFVPVSSVAVNFLLDEGVVGINSVI
jgi:hypothetical protein